MRNKTIYVSENDEPLFEEAKQIAGEALSSVIARALREFVSRNKEKSKGMKEISVQIGSHGSEREQRFTGAEVGKWTGFSTDKQWWMSAKIYRTQKNNWAVYLVTLTKASLLTDKNSWKKSGEYLENSHRAELLVAEDPKEFEKKLPETLYQMLSELAQRDEKPIEYLDI